jgi:hypothetical protein
LPSGAVSRRFVCSADCRPGTRISHQDDDGFPDWRPRQQSRHVRPHTHRHARATRRHRRLFGWALESKPQACARASGDCRRAKTTSDTGRIAQTRVVPRGRAGRGNSILSSHKNLATKRRTKQSDKDTESRYNGILEAGNRWRKIACVSIESIPSHPGMSANR